MSNSLFYQNCNYSGYLKPDSIYYVYNPNYPNVSNGRQYCRWFAESAFRVRLTCDNFNIPWNFRCILNRLTVYVNDSASQSYCGNKSFSIESTGRFITIELSTSFWSSGIKFLCELQAIDETDDNDFCRCGWKKPTKIVGGMETGVNEYPMMAGLVDSLQAEVFCGATIISERHVLTAAHCLENVDPSTVGVLVGDHDLTTGADTNASRLYTVSRFYVHPLYNTEAPAQNDIAVVMVNSVISFSEEVGPACLPFEHQFDSFAGSYVDLLGWGLTEFSGMKSSTLQKVTVTVITNRQCRQQYPGISNDHICTYAEEKDACQFDSGGPVLWQNPTTKREVLVGVITAGMGCGSNKAGINMRVGAYIDWILSVTPSLLPVWGSHNPGLFPRDAILFRIVQKCFGP
ncbi:PREDICTED: venom serine protease 34-like [Atta colombica]|uniref:venom serine protease 34-like n=1 Tax=Atta colombica TaxID=520822 RepID=UPI00084BF206|nr:PREDICTED: venom serine protease 34-like [Atta colombica]